MFNFSKSQLKSANQIEVVQSFDHFWTDLSNNESASYTGGKILKRCRTKLDGTYYCVEYESGV